MAAAANDALGFWPRWLSGGVMWSIFGGLIVLLVVGKILLGRPVKARPLDQAGSVIGIVGRMGSGKSYFAVRTAYTQLRAGANVCSNFFVDVEAIGAGGRWSLFQTWGDLGKLSGEYVELVGGEWVRCDPRARKRGKRRLVRRLVVIVDEAQLLAPSSEAWKFGRQSQKTLGNLRKYGIDLYWLSQHETRVAKRLRDSTNLIYVCKGRRGRNGRVKFEAAAYEPENVRKEKSLLYRMRYYLDLSIADLYDTLEVIDPDAPEDQGDKDVAVVVEREVPAWVTASPVAAGWARPVTAEPAARRGDEAG